jgi:hypothetical protein
MERGGIGEGSSGRGKNGLGWREEMPAQLRCSSSPPLPPSLPPSLSPSDLAFIEPCKASIIDKEASPRTERLAWPGVEMATGGGREGGKEGSGGPMEPW